MRRIIPAILLIAVLAIGGGIIASTAYQAGLQTAVATSADGTATTVVVPAYGVGYGWHPFGFGFGFLGFLGALLFFVLVFGLIRAIFFGGRHRHWDGWGPGWGPGGPGAGRPSGGRYERWEAVLHQDFDEWHRGAHGPASGPSGQGGPDGGTTTPPAAAG